MADLPILFSGPMVRAILSEIETPGTGKTQTRRILKQLPNRTIFFDAKKAGLNQYQSPRIGVGDRLYVREHWRVSQKWDATAPRDLPARTMTVFFNAGGTIANQASGKWEPDNAYPASRPYWVGKHRQGMHMPKWASRITLIVEGVKVERLQDISEADALAEGVDTERCCGVSSDSCGTHLDGCCGQPEAIDPVEAYQALWDDINGPGAWDANPWVVAYTFRPILSNIDQIGGAA